MSQLFTWGGQSTRVSALESSLSKDTQHQYPSEWTGWFSLQSKGLSRLFSNTTVQKHQFYSAQLSPQSNSHIYMTTGKTIALTRRTLEVVKQEMGKVNIDILGINEQRLTGMGEFKTDGHYIYYCGQESIRRNGVAIMINKSPKCSSWMQCQNRQNDLCSSPRQTIQYHSYPSLCPNK